MRSTLIGLLVGCGLMAITAFAALACPYQSSASNDQASQQMAQTQSSTQTDSQ
jgi:hypothetical protein